MLILGIETTCDETGAAVVEGNPSTSSGLRVLSNVVASSVDLQNKYGGVVPEVAAREQIKVIIPVVEEALVKAFEVGGERWENGSRSGKLEKKISHILPLTSKIDAIAVAYGPGLIGSLLIGVETAKTLALAWDKPLIPVNHLVGHIYANWLAPVANGEWQMVNGESEKTTDHKPYAINFPLIALIVSGGHTDLVLVMRHGDFKLLGSTLDDAAGEAFDKIARLLGLGYPGGPEIERLASQIRSTKSEIRNIKFPRPMMHKRDFSARGGPASGWDFSFSGLKTAVANIVRGEKLLDNDRKAEIAQEFQKAVADVLVKKTIDAAEKFACRSIVVGGGVAANELLRSQLTDHSSRLGIRVYFPSKNLSVDNGAMIAAAAFFVDKKISPLKLQVEPSLHF